MRIQGFTGSVPATTDSKSVAFSNQKNGSPNIVARQFVTNRNSISPSYLTCDGFLRFIDSVWEDFTPATQALWEAASAANVPYFICGGCNDVPGGKVFHRLVNFGAWLFNAPITNTPPPARTGSVSGAIEIATFRGSGPGRPSIAFYSDSPGSATWYLCINMGKCRYNPMSPWTGTVPIPLFPGNSLCDGILAVPSPAQFSCCVWDENFNPLATGPTIVVTFDQ